MFSFYKWVSNLPFNSTSLLILDALDSLSVQICYFLLQCVQNIFYNFFFLSSTFFLFFTTIVYVFFWRRMEYRYDIAVICNVDETLCTIIWMRIFSLISDHWNYDYALYSNNFIIFKRTVLVVRYKFIHEIYSSFLNQFIVIL